MTRLLAAVAAPALALAACAPTAPAPVGQPASLAPADRFVAAVEAEGCLLTAQNVGSILLRANLTQADVAQVTPQLAAAGRAEVSGEGQIRVLTDNCI